MLPLLGELSSGGRRYQELPDVLDGISHKVLTETLRRVSVAIRTAPLAASRSVRQTAT
jgi:hypothetical protein